MMTIPAAPPAQAPTSLAVTWAMLGKFVAQLAASRAHADVTDHREGRRAEADSRHPDVFAEPAASIVG